MIGYSALAGQCEAESRPIRTLAKNQKVPLVQGTVRTQSTCWSIRSRIMPDNGAFQASAPNENKLIVNESGVCERP
eukprot:scaffold1149_cov165-Amphora_coffeaeformis.AAC.2